MTTTTAATTSKRFHTALPRHHLSGRISDPKPNPAAYLAFDAEQDVLGAGDCRPGLCREVFRGGAADRMVDDDEGVVLRPQHPAHQFGGGDEFRGHDGGGRQTEALADDRVMQTARRAAASIADTGDQRVPALGVVEQAGFGRRAVVGLGQAGHFGDAVIVE